MLWDVVVANWVVCQFAVPNDITVQQRSGREVFFSQPLFAILSNCLPFPTWLKNGAIWSCMFISLIVTLTYSTWNPSTILTHNYLFFIWLVTHLLGPVFVCVQVTMQSSLECLMLLMQRHIVTFFIRMIKMFCYVLLGVFDNLIWDVWFGKYSYPTKHRGSVFLSPIIIAIYGASPFFVVNPTFCIECTNTHVSEWNMGKK